jgi:hypothetical protein
MSIIDRYRQYAEAFEATYEDDDWTRLEAYFAEDATYDTGQGPDATVTGREALLGHLKTSLDSFDRKLDSRELEFIGDPREEGDRVIVGWEARYTKAGAPDLVLSGTEVAEFSGDRIKRLRDEFDESATQALQDWMAKYGKLLASSQ